MVKPATKDSIAGAFKVQRGASNTKTVNTFYSISFEGVTISNLTIHSDLVGKLVSVDDNRSELHLKGAIRLSKHNLGANQGAEVKLSRAFVRAVLRTTADSLE